MRYVYLILAMVVLGVGSNLVINWDRSMGLRNVAIRLKSQRAGLRIIAAHLRDYKKSTGRYPSNDEGLLVLTDLRAKCGAVREMRRWDYQLRDFRPSRAGFLSIWGEPLIYENRRGMDPRKFADSGATRDRQRAYSIRVDRDVYVWSLGAEQAYLFYEARHPKVVAAELLVVGISGFLVVLYVVGTIRNVGQGLPRLRRVYRIGLSFAGGAALALASLALGLPIMVGSSCYAWSRLKDRSPELTAESISLARKYRDRGIISDGAYKKLVNVLKTEDPYDPSP